MNAKEAAALAEEVDPRYPSPDPYLHYIRLVVAMGGRTYFFPEADWEKVFNALSPLGFRLEKVLSQTLGWGVRVSW